MRVPIFFFLAQVFMTSHTLGNTSFSASFEDLISSQVHSVLSDVTQLLKKGKTAAYLQNHRVFPGDSIVRYSQRHGFIGHFEHSLKKGIYQYELKRVTFFVYTRSGSIMSVGVKFSDLQTLLSAEDADKLMVLSLLFRNTNPNARISYFGQSPTNAPDMLHFYENLNQVEKSVLTAKSYQFLSKFVERSIAFALMDTLSSVTTFLDESLERPFLIDRVDQREVIQIPDMYFPGEFKDSVVQITYNLMDFKMDVTRHVVKISCQTGETIYCQRKELFGILPKHCQKALELFQR